MHRFLPLIVAALVVALAPPALGDSGISPRPESEVRAAARHLDEVAARLEALDRSALLPEHDAGARMAASLSVLDVEMAAAHLAAAEAIGVMIPGGEGLVEDVGASAPFLALYVDAAGLADPAPILSLLQAWSEFLDASQRADAIRKRLTAGFPSVAAVRVCPVDGPFEVGETWGAPRPWGREHKGVDLHAERGTPLVAVESGTVVQRGWHWAGGLGVYLLGETSGDVYYYAHLDGIVPDLHPGDRVEAGALLGWVGWTGNADVAHLHLGWIPHHGPGWVSLDGLTDPLPMVVSACG
jgi:murein DD-endopeptidase MepM/ murein hydrolase activator NlpD